nr:immunoglobulin light chain junction region [Macaca mulatta]MOY02588.1 immunoglobulin light chain junction region [Macaca mulatta]
CMQATHPPWTF